MNKNFKKQIKKFFEFKRFSEDIVRRKSFGEMARLFR